VNKNVKAISVIAALLAFFWLSCATVKYQQDIGQHQDEIKKLEA